MLMVVKNTYPEFPKVPHAKVGDVCSWEFSMGAFRLIRQSDGKTVFATSEVNKDGLLVSSGQPPKLIGVIAQVKSKGWIFEIMEVK